MSDREMNAYFKDSGIFLREAAKCIKKSMKKEDIIHATFEFSLGMERILKGILFDINPIYILMGIEFKNSMAVLYSDKVIDVEGGFKELSSSPNSDVITFRNSLLRAQMVSEITYKNKSLLFTLSNARDIIAHHELSLLEMEKLEVMLKRDFYLLMSDYSHELNIPLSKFVHSYDIRLAEIAHQYQESIEIKVRMKLDAHMQRWRQLGNTPGYVEDKEMETKGALQHKYNFPIGCPACDNWGILHTKPSFEYNPYEKREVIIGLFVKRFQCRYCKLSIDDYREIDFLNLYQGAYELGGELSIDIDKGLISTKVNPNSDNANEDDANEA